MPAGSSIRYWPAACRYCRSKMTSGSDGFVDSSTASMTTDPLWRITSRVVLWPPGSITVSVKTLKTFPLNASLEETSFAFAEGFFRFAAFLEEVCSLADFEVFLPVCT